ncbi:MAG: response regulator transcription factor [Sphingomonadales bacterium]|nr:response regulator transcription factor [Sphingomonadales bacterium]
MSRILCVDDEPAILRLLAVVLAADGHEAVAAANGRDAIALAGRGGIDAVLLDLGLPDRDGLELIAALRKVSPAPILIVSARGEVAEKVAALDLGAADYITKPFDGDEVRARLRAALRQSQTARTPDGELRHGSIRMLPDRHEAEVSGRQLSLTPKEYAVLQALVEAAGRVLTHAALLERVWGKAHRGDVEYLRVAVRALRLKIESDPSRPEMIRNEPGIGYRLA